MRQTWVWNGRVAARFRPLIERMDWERWLRVQKVLRAAGWFDQP